MERDKTKKRDRRRAETDVSVNRLVDEEGTSKERREMSKRYIKYMNRRDGYGRRGG